jgi:hypothetical protein
MTTKAVPNYRTPKAIAISRRTGDLFAIPLRAGIAIGRVGCFLAGLQEGRPGIVKGLAIAAALTFLLNAARAAIFLAMLASANFH